MRLNRDRVERWARSAPNEVLLDRVTVLRPMMDEAALPILEQELADRGVTAEDRLQHEARLRDRVVRLADGTLATCSFCPRAATGVRWGWYRFWGLLPLLPKRIYFCPDHETA